MRFARDAEFSRSALNRQSPRRAVCLWLAPRTLPRSVAGVFYAPGSAVVTRLSDKIATVAT
jgi:hypothetical protein